jgi:hypothetical protein
MGRNCQAPGSDLYRNYVDDNTEVFLLVACFAAGALFAANDPFVGEWKLNGAKSKLIDVMKVESVAGNKYAFDFGAGSAETIAADGTDQPGLAGTTLSVTIEGADSWKVVRKKDGHILLTGIWKLSKDGNTLNDDYTEFARDGSASSNVKYAYQRTAGTAGFAGTWEASTDAANMAIVLKVQAYEGDGLSFINSSGVTRNVKLDGKEYPNAGANVRAGSVSTARRVNEGTLEMTDKFNGKVTNTRELQLSADRKTLTMTVHVPGRREADIFVFERQ